MKLRKRIKAALKSLPAGYHSVERLAIAAGARPHETAAIPEILRQIRGKMMGDTLMATSTVGNEMFVSIHR
jgi:hypothetical protein